MNAVSVHRFPAKLSSLIGERVSPIQAYVACLALLVLTLLVAVIGAGQRLDQYWVVAALAGIAAIANRGTVSITRNLEIDVVTLPVVLAAVVVGPLAAMIVAAASMLSDLVPRRGVDSPYLKWATYTLTRALSGGISGIVAAACLGAIEGRVGAVFAATAAAAVVLDSLDVLFVSITLRLRGAASSLLDGIKALAPLIASSVPLHTPVLALLAFAYLEVSEWTLPLFFAPGLLAHRLFVLYHDQRQLADDLLSANKRLERANVSFATALVATLDARDRYTAGHSAAVAIYARDIAARMGLSEEEQELAHLCGLVHDIGKIGLPPGLLEKTGPISLEERRQMEAHSVIGERILSKVEDYAEIAAVVRHHHERWDGFGYPDGLAGERIPLTSRIIAVADAYNAMTSDRPYRDAMPSRVARLRLAQAAESQFDTSVVAAFEAILAGADEMYRLAHGSAFSFEVQSAPSLAVAVA